MLMMLESMLTELMSLVQLLPMSLHLHLMQLMQLMQLPMIMMMMMMMMMPPLAGGPCP
jgi:hypothetical protein